MPQPGGRVGDYLVVDALGRGGMGAVYGVRHVRTGVAYALKVLTSSDRDGRAFARFRREVEALARTDGHPAIVRIHATGADATGRPYYVMERIEGAPPAAPMPAPEAARLIAALASAVEHLHACGIVHRDLKTANVLVDRDGSPRLLDLGIAYDAFAATLTATGDAVGTPAYMAPEQLGSGSGERRLGPPTDVYGLGAMLYELLTGRPPFLAASPVEMMAAVLRRAPERPRSLAPETPPAIEAVCLRALAKDPAARYPTAAELARDLERFLAGEPVAARGFGRPRRALVALATLAIVVAIVAAAVAATIRRDRASDAVFDAAARARAEELARRAFAGELEALEEAAALASAGALADAEDARAIELLAALADGDGETLAAADLARPPFRNDERGAGLVRVLAAAGRGDALAALLARRPEAAPRLAPTIAEVVVAGRAAVTDEVADGVVAALEGSARGRDPARREELRALVLRFRARRLVARVDERDAAGELLAIVRTTGALPALDAAERTRIAEAGLAADPLVVEGLDPRLELAALATIEAPGGELDERVRERLVSVLLQGETPFEPAISEAALGAGVLLLRAGGLLVRPEMLGSFCPDEALVIRHIEAERARGEPDPWALWLLTALRRGRAPIDLAAIEDRRGRQAARTLVVWPLIEELLVAASRDPAAPAPWLAWLAEILGSALCPPAAEAAAEEEDPSARLADRVRTRFEEDEVADAVDRLFRDASARERGRPPGAGHVIVPYERSRWIFRMGASSYEAARRAHPHILRAVEVVNAAPPLGRRLRAQGPLDEDVAWHAYWIGRTLTDAAAGRGEEPCAEEESLATLRRALAAGPLSRHAIGEQIEMIHDARHGRAERAVAELERIPLAHANVWATHEQLGRILADQGRRGLAARVLEHSASGDRLVFEPTWFEGRAEVWERLGRDDRAEADREVARRLREGP